jgi:hypothetical protein
MSAGPGAQSRARADGFYVWRPPSHAIASVAVQSRWGNLYHGPATIRSLAVDVCRHAHVFADIAAPTADPVAGRLPGRSFRLRVRDIPAPPFRGRCRVLLSLGEVTDLVSALVVLAPCLDPAGDGIRVLITAAAPGAVFGLAGSQAGRPPNVVRQAARTIRLLVEATVTGHGDPRPGIRTGDFD